MERDDEEQTQEERLTISARRMSMESGRPRWKDHGSSWEDGGGLESVGTSDQKLNLHSLLAFSAQAGEH